MSLPTRMMLKANFANCTANPWPVAEVGAVIRAQVPVPYLLPKS